MKGDYMKASELIKILKRNGCKLIRNDGNHDIWYSPITKIETAVPRHPSKELPTGTCKTILKNMGL